MFDLEPIDLHAILDEFEQALSDCTELYRVSAAECSRSHAEQGGGSRQEFVRRMVDLSYGLLLKVFVEVAYSDRHWNATDLALAGVLAQHIWGRELTQDQLKKALNHFQEQADISWDTLLGPFERIDAFRNRAPELQTVVMRLANLVAKADGTLQPEEERQLQWIQAELKRVLERVPLASQPPEHTAVALDTHKRLQQVALAIPGLQTRDRVQTKEQVKTATNPRESVEQALAELDELIGLSEIKQSIRSLVNFLNMQKAREGFDLPPTTISLHGVFTGNPGTGKTSVARLLGRIYGAMGLLAQGHLIETDRSGLVAEYAGQTAPKVHRKIDEAVDGILFIDEAYSLVAEKGDDPYGTEALQVLLKRMEDDRDRLVVILAGYPRPMEKLLKRNPGLASRFSRRFAFPDYTASELGQIFHALCRKNRYSVPPLAQAKLILGFHYLLGRKDERFGNGRLVRNIFEHSIGRLANRISGIMPLTRELLTVFAAEDIEMESVPAEIWNDLEDENRLFRIVCPGCRHSSRLPQKYLGHKVNCKRCSQSFTAEWGEVVTDN
jgi:tellurite resistance protein